MPQFFPTGPSQSGVEPSSSCLNGEQYDLLVMNLEFGLTGIVSVSAPDRVEAIRLYERTNPTCAVISVMKPDHYQTGPSGS